MLIFFPLYPSISLEITNGSLQTCNSNLASPRTHKGSCSQKKGWLLLEGIASSASHPNWVLPPPASNTSPTHSALALPCSTLLADIPEFTGLPCPTTVHRAAPASRVAFWKGTVMCTAGVLFIKWPKAASAVGAQAPAAVQPNRIGLWLFKNSLYRLL